MARRLPSSPPVLPGFSHVHVLGAGGFADVFLYEQNLPRRQVAVKVLLSEVVDDGARRMFQAEANLMAQLSAHPSILTVYGAGVSADGRPWLAMELCSSALGERYRREQIPVREVLGIAVRIGSAIETAHRAGVLHRDLKPGNILVTAYGHPVLSDFGIAATLGRADSDGLVGLSVPWSAPEVLGGETAGTVASEVWAFAATIYTLLAGRSPFESAGDTNTPVELARRIGRERLRSTGRSDVPDSLERVLARGMSSDPHGRPASMLELVMLFRGVEEELGSVVSPVEVAVADWALPSVSRLEDRTVLTAPGGGVTTRPRRRGTEDAGVVRAGDRGGEHRVDRVRLLGNVWFRLGVAALVVGVAGLVFALSALLGDAPSEIPVVNGITATLSAGAATFRWTDPGLSGDDSYEVTTDGDSSSVQSRPEFTVAAAAGDRVCLTVAVNRDGRSGEPSAQKCVSLPS